MVSHSVKGTNKSARYSYYRCIKHRREGDEACVNAKSYRANELEQRVWQFVSGLLKDPERIRKGLEAVIEEERAGMLGDPQRQPKVWLKKLSEVDNKRSRFQDMAAEGLIPSTSSDRSSKRSSKCAKRPEGSWKPSMVVRRRLRSLRGIETP